MTSPLSAPVGISPAGPKTQQRGIRLPQLLLSLLVVAVFALLAVWWQANTNSRTPVVALATAVERGQTISPTDLTEIYISTDVPTSAVDAQFSSTFVGTVPVIDLPAGTLITGEMFRLDAPLLSGQAYVGLVLDGTRSPTSLSFGDRVQVLRRVGDDFEILSPDAIVESAVIQGDEVTIRLRMDVTSAQQVQLNANTVVVIEVEKGEPAPWESGDPS